jgi:hypothetical protein
VYIFGLGRFDDFLLVATGGGQQHRDNQKSYSEDE